MPPTYHAARARVPAPASVPVPLSFPFPLPLPFLFFGSGARLDITRSISYRRAAFASHPPMPIALSPQALQKIAQVRSRYPDPQAACLPALHIAQDELGYLPDEAVKLVAEALGLPEGHVFGVITFYTMFHRHPKGRNVLMVCTNVSCMLGGGYRVLDQVCRALGVKPGETTADGAVTVIEEECLAACADAPMAICDQKYFLRLDAPAKVEAMLAELKKASA